MRQIRMIFTLSGGGPGNRDWRDFPAGTELDVEDWEADELVRGAQVAVEVHGRLAVPAEEDPGDSAAPGPVAEAPAETEPGPGASAHTELPGTPDDGISPLAAVSPVAQAAVTARGLAGEPDDQSYDQPPAAAESKQRWIEYAILRGATPDGAAAMTKADLMSRYGGRL